MTGCDIPSPINFCDPNDAREWERTAQSRPERESVFRALAAELGGLKTNEPHVLELGSGPGFLAQILLHAIPDIRLTLLDFSPAMHELARARIGEAMSQVHFVERNFKDPNWTDGLGSFDAIITNQAVHELRHKRYAVALHSQVHKLLRPGTPYLVCDHFYGDGAMSDDQLYMTVAEQKHALEGAGFTDIHQVLLTGSLVMHRASLGLSGFRE